VNHDHAWLGECLSAPWESVALAAVALSLIRGASFLLGGFASGTVSTPTPPEVAKAYGFVGFGAGALVGFGTRELIGWLRSLMKAMFPMPKTEVTEAENQSHTFRRSKAS
jgi:hypothetical protein